MEEQDVYQRLAEHLNNLGMGYPIEQLSSKSSKKISLYLKLKSHLRFPLA